MESTVQGHDPYDTLVQTGASYKYIRLGSGRLTEWDKDAKSEIEHASIIGSLERISEFTDEYDQAKGFPAEKLELVFKHRGGTQYNVQTRIASGVCIRHLAGYLAHASKGQVLALTADPGEKKVTFPRLHAWDGMGWKPLPRDKYENGDAIEAIRRHEAYGDRPQRRVAEDGKPDYSTPMDSFFQAAVTAGWPAPTGIEAAYCEVFTKALKRPIGTFADVTDADWATLTEGVAAAKSVPKALATAKPAAAPTPKEEYDPFAD